MKRFDSVKWITENKHGKTPTDIKSLNEHLDNFSHGEGKMALGDLVELADDANDVAAMIQKDTNLPEWVEAKITLSADYINTVKDYLSSYDATSHLNEQGFDDRFKDAMGGAGFSDEEQDDIMSRDVGSPFPGEDEAGMAPRYSPFAAKAKDYIEKFRQEYRDMSDDGMDEFSVEIINHLLDNTAAQAAAKVFFAKKGL